MKSQTTTAIVLAAGKLPEALQAGFGKTSSAMLPVNGRPTIHWSLHYLSECGIRKVIIAVREGETRIQRFVRHCFGKLLDTQFVEIREDRGPGYSLMTCLENLSDAESCLVVLGDTLFSFPELEDAAWRSSFVMTSSVPDASRWCLAEVVPVNLVKRLVDKPSVNPSGCPALIGVYYLQNTLPAKSALQAKAKGTDGALQLSDALQPYIDAGELFAFDAKEWYDCGHVDFLSHSRRRLLKAREFNTLELDDLRGTLTKRSRHTQKFLGEINYYRLLPADLASFFPRLLGYSIRPSEAFLKLEYYGYPTLSELWVFEEMDGQFWKGILAQIARILTCFADYEVELQSSAVFHLYWTKTQERLDAFARQSPAFDTLVKANLITLNGVELPGWPVIGSRVRERVCGMAEHARGTIIHGDLCFPNILFDPVGRIFKFIDPRGSFGEAGLWGDPRYDLAKLLHSMDGGYDFLIHDMFSLRQDGMKLDLQQFTPDNRLEVLAHFDATFSGAYRLSEIRLIEGLLFLSMCALHSDKPQRQTAMFAIGLRILNEVLADSACSPSNFTT